MYYYKRAFMLQNKVEVRNFLPYPSKMLWNIPIFTKYSLRASLSMSVLLMSLPQAGQPTVDQSDPWLDDLSSSPCLQALAANVYEAFSGPRPGADLGWGWAEALQAVTSWYWRKVWHTPAENAFFSVYRLMPFSILSSSFTFMSDVRRRLIFVFLQLPPIPC